MVEQGQFVMEGGCLQVLYYECLVKIIRAQPVRARMLISNVLYNCNASLSPQEVQAKAAKVCTLTLHAV